MQHPLRVGLFGIGLDAYWPQFVGLKERLEGYVQIVGERLQRPGVEVVWPEARGSERYPQGGLGVIIEGYNAFAKIRPLTTPGHETDPLLPPNLAPRRKPELASPVAGYCCRRKFARFV